jgi:acyl-CoA thioesterase-1
MHLLKHIPGLTLRTVLTATLAMGLGVLATSTLTTLSSSPAQSQTPPAAECAMPADLVPTEKLPHVAARIAYGEPIKIVAFGSSSTAGTGATTEAATYPSQMQAELQAMFPNSEITVLNRGVPGERVKEMSMRFKHDVLAEKPDLLVWQTGTNSALSHGDIGDYVDGLAHGVDKARAHGIDVILMTPQLSPRFEEAPQREAYLDYITRLAAFRDVPVIRRYEIMQYWLDSKQMTRAEMLNPDGLHMTDLSYHCLGVTAARIVAAAINHPSFNTRVLATRK